LVLAVGVFAATLLIGPDARHPSFSAERGAPFSVFESSESWHGPGTIDAGFSSEGRSSLRVDMPANDARFVWREARFPATPGPWRMSFMVHTRTPQNLGRLSVMARSGGERDRDDTIFSVSGLEPGWNRVVVPSSRFFRHWFSRFDWSQLRAIAFRVESNGGGPLTLHIDDLRIETDPGTKDVPPAVLRVTATATPGGTARIRWMTDLPTAGRVVYGPTAEYGSYVESPAGSSKQHEVRLEDLTPGGRIHLRVEARSATSHGASGDVLLRVPAFASADSGGSTFDLALFGANSQDDLADAAGTAFDLFQSYQHSSDAHNTNEDVRRYLDLAAARGARVIAGFSRERIKARDLAYVRERVQRLKNHPALRGWYLYDEPEISKLPADVLRACYQAIRAADPSHPVYIAASVLSTEYPYLDGCDVVLFDRYPVPYHPIESLAAPLEAARRSGKPYGYVFQAFAHDIVERWPTAGAGPARLPGYDEMRTMAWLGALHGANGLWAFSYNFLHDTPGTEWKWTELTSLADEIRTLRPALAMGPSTELRVVSTPAPAIEAACWSDRGAHYIVALNRSRLVVKGELRLAGPDVSAARRFETGEPAEASASSIRDTWAANETRIYRIAR